MSFEIVQRVQAAARGSGPDNRVAYLSRNNVVEFHCDYRRDVIVRIRIVGIRGAERRAGEKKHQAENDAPKITMLEQTCSFAPPAPNLAQ